MRPGVNDFLKELGKYYELVMFTASVKDYADWIVDNIDPERLFDRRLYRPHCKY